MKKVLYVVFLFTLSLNSQNILDEKDRARVVNEILKDRFENLLPKLMDRTGIDMWILISREYNEDPVLKTMLPAEWLNARRRTIILFYRDKTKNTLDKLAVARYNFGENIISAWDKEVEPNQWKRLNQLIEERNPKTIGINYSKYFNIADGIDKTDYEEFIANISKENRDKIISAQKLATAWIETRTTREMEIFSDIVEITHNIINEAFSSVVGAWRKEFPEIDYESVNANGGSIAIGHPLGATGARLMTNLVHEMKRNNFRYGLQAICEGGGTANATIVELV